MTKNDQGGMAKKQQPPKEVLAYGPENPDRNIVNLYKQYVSKCPVLGKTDAFFRQSCRGTAITDEAWYTRQPVGLNTLSLTVKRIMKAAGIPGKWTNHSLRSGCATTLHRANVEEQTIKNVTGHRSDAVRSYKRESLQTMKRAERVLLGNPVKTRSKSEPNYIRHKPIINWSHSTPKAKPLTPERNVNVHAPIDDEAPHPTIKEQTSTTRLGMTTRSCTDADRRAMPPPPATTRACRRTTDATPTSRKPDEQPYRCQEDDENLEHTAQCAAKCRTCGNEHRNDGTCCNFLCGFSDFLHGGKVPPKKFRMSLTFQRARKSSKEASSTSTSADK
jgi:hypothetical protein